MELKNHIRIRMERTFPALTHKNFRSFWIGQSISLIGTWMQTTTQSWLVLKISTQSSSSLLLGVINALQFLPILLFSLFSGVIIDKFSKRKLLIFTQSSFMFFSLLQGILVWTGVVQFWHLAIIAFLVGSINSIDMPTRQSFVIELVGKEHLMNALALNSSIFNAARVLGPSIAGCILAYVSIESCYFINAVSFIPVIIGIINIKYVYTKKDLGEKHIIKNIKEGLVYIKKEETLVRTFTLITILGIFAFNYNILIPLFSVNILKLGSKEYGFLMSALGVGSLTGALTMVAKGKKPKKKVLNLASILIVTLLILLGINRNFHIMAVLLAFIGIFNVTFSTSANSTVQLYSKDEYRGRVMSVYTMLFAGVSPIGSLFTGFVSNSMGPEMAFVCSGVISAILISLLFIREGIKIH